MSPSKYRNVRTVYKGQLYHSKAEARYAQLLDVMTKALSPEFKVLRYTSQVPYLIVVKGTKIGTYYADFVVEYADGHQEVIDVKGVRTAVYKLKKKLVEALHEVHIREVSPKELI